MATDPLGEFLKRFDDLSPQQRQELLSRLEQHEAIRQNGSSIGRTLLDAFKDDGMVGSITDAPADWSSNPKHMERFGKDA